MLVKTKLRWKCFGNDSKSMFLFMSIYVNTKACMFVNIFSLGLLKKVGGAVESVFIVRKEIDWHGKPEGTFSLGDIKIDMIKDLSQRGSS